MIVYHLHYVKSENGLWFYSLDLLTFISVNVSNKILVICSKWQIPFIEKLGMKYRIVKNALDFLGISLTFRNQMQICPTLRPVIGRKTITIIHDFWPIMQSSLPKRTLAKILFFGARQFSNVYYISQYHAQIYGSKNILPNRLDHSKNDFGKINVHAKYCDILLIGTETKRKRLELLKHVLGQAFPKTATLKIIIVGSEINQDLPFEYCLEPPEQLINIFPRTEESTYVSLSIEEGFNRGAKIAEQKGFKLLLSNIGVHREFFPNAMSIEFSGNDICTKRLSIPQTWDQEKINARYSKFLEAIMK